MSYKTTIVGLGNLNKIFEVFVDTSSKNDDQYTYFLISKITDCSFKITRYYIFDIFADIKFKQLYEINEYCEECTFENSEFVDIEFATEEELLYWNMKYEG